MKKVLLGVIITLAGVLLAETITVSTTVMGKSWAWTLSTDPKAVSLTCGKPMGSDFGPVGSIDTCTLVIDTPAPNVGGSGGWPVPQGQYTVSDPRLQLLPSSLTVPAGSTQASYQVKRVQ